MRELSTIPGMDPESLDLIEAAGFLSTQMLAKADVDELTQELLRANQVLRISKTVPQRDRISTWINHARDLIGGAEEIAYFESMEPSVDHVGYQETQKLLESAPLAIPLPTRLLMEQQIRVSEIPTAILLDHLSDDIEVRIGGGLIPTPKLPQALSSASPSNASQNVKIAEANPNRAQIDSTKIKPIEVLSGKAQRKTGSGPEIQNERLALLRTTRAETNRGVDSNSRRYVRGVLHNSPVKMAFGAILTLTLAALLPVAIISAILLFCSSEIPIHFHWVPNWIIVFPIVLPLLGLVYLLLATKCSCRICGQKLFFPRACLKNSKAHHLSGLGYIIPVCIHMLLFKWFRCTYCGTPVRLKE
jgi:hypothetical protein